MTALDKRNDKNRRRVQICYLTGFWFALIAVSYVNPAAIAGSVSSRLGVSARVVRNCSISSSSLNFGEYDPTSTHATMDLNTKTVLTVACTRDSSPTVSVGLGNHAASGITTLSMSNGVEQLSHEVYKDTGLTQVWGATSLVPLTPSFKISTQSIIIPVHGRIPAGQFVHPGNYTDFLVVTINF